MRDGQAVGGGGWGAEVGHGCGKGENSSQRGSVGNIGLLMLVLVWNSERSLCSSGARLGNYTPLGSQT